MVTFWCRTAKWLGKAAVEMYLASWVMCRSVEDSISIWPLVGNWIKWSIWGRGQYLYELRKAVFMPPHEYRANPGSGTAARPRPHACCLASEAEAGRSLCWALQNVRELHPQKDGVCCWPGSPEKQALWIPNLLRTVLTRSSSEKLLFPEITHIWPVELWVHQGITLLMTLEPSGSSYLSRPHLNTAVFETKPSTHEPFGGLQTIAGTLFKEC